MDTNQNFEKRDRLLAKMMNTENELKPINDWYSLSMEQREKKAYGCFQKKYPNGDKALFYQMEIRHWDREVTQFEVRHDNPEHFETRFAVEAERMLKYYRKKEKDLNTKIGNKITWAVIALFCNLIAVGNLIKRGQNESIPDYCKRVCSHYKLDYADNVRQNFNGSDTRRNRKKLVSLVLPKIDTQTRTEIQKYLDNNPR
jgi:hypothetical protein